MRERSAAPVVAASVVLALLPVLPWLLATLFDGLDRRWLDSLSGLEVSIPAALGVCAVGLAVHGLRLQRDLADDMAAEYEAFARFGGTGGTTVRPTVATHAGPEGVVAVAVANGAPPAAAAATTDATPAAVAAAPAGASEEPGAEGGGKMTIVQRGAGVLSSPKVDGIKQHAARRAKGQARMAARRAFRDIFRS